jgi:hypothetical protein
MITYEMLSDDKLGRPYSYLYGVLGNETVTVYEQMDINSINMTNAAYNSFNETLRIEMNYSYFLDEMRNHFKGWNMKTRIDHIEDLSVMLPKLNFIGNVTDLI